MPKRIGIYEIEGTLGEGTFGKVKQARNTETGDRVAIKMLDKEKIQKENMGNQVKREISIMKMVRHPNVIRLYEVLASKAKIYIVIELVTGGELFRKIVENKRLDDQTSRFYFQQLCVAVHYCNCQGICHRDLKPENLLLDKDGNLKISDFGLSNIFKKQGGSHDLLQTTCGTPNYVAPEVIRDRSQGYDGAIADTWSIGIILYVFLAGYLPFDEPTLALLLQKIHALDYQVPDHVSPTAKDLISKILVTNPQQRLRIPQIAKHSWWLEGGPHQYAAEELEKMLEASKVNDSSSVHSAQMEADTQAQPMSVDQRSQQVQPMFASPPQQPNVNLNFFQPQQQQQQPPPVPNQTPGIPTLGGFALLDLLNGGPLSNLVGERNNSLIFLTKMSPPDVLSMVKASFHGIDGLVRAEPYFMGTKLLGQFNIGRGIVMIKASVKLCGINPPLYALILKKAGGDLITFEKICEKLQILGEFLHKSS